MYEDHNSLGFLAQNYITPKLAICNFMAAQTHNGDPNLSNKFLIL